MGQQKFLKSPYAARIPDVGCRNVGARPVSTGSLVSLTHLSPTYSWRSSNHSSECGCRWMGSRSCRCRGYILGNLSRFGDIRVVCDVETRLHFPSGCILPLAISHSKTGCLCISPPIVPTNELAHAHAHCAVHSGGINPVGRWRDMHQPAK